MLAGERKEERALPLRGAGVKRFDAVYAALNRCKHGGMLVRADLAGVRQHRDPAGRMRHGNSLRDGDVLAAHKAGPPFEQVFIERIRPGCGISLFHERVGHVQPRDEPFALHSILDRAAHIPQARKHGGVAPLALFGAFGKRFSDLRRVRVDP